MSVPVNQRSHGKLEVCIKAHELCCYTLKITANDKIFVPQFHESLTKHIEDTALAVHILCWEANNVVVKSTEEFKMRQHYQDEAAIKCNVLLSLIDMAKNLFHLTTKRVTYWSNLVIETRNLIRKWRESDITRYQEFRV